VLNTLIYVADCGSFEAIDLLLSREYGEDCGIIVGVTED